MKVWDELQFDEADEENVGGWGGGWRRDEVLRLMKTLTTLKDNSSLR